MNLLGFWTAVLAATVAIPALASQSVELEWQPSISPNVVGYNIYYGGSVGDYTNEVSVGDITNLTLSGLADDTTYYFAAKAVNSSEIDSVSSIQTDYAVPTAAAIFGEPLFSNGGVSFPVTGVPGYPYEIEASTNLTNWVPVQTNVSPMVFADTNAWRYPERFYRAIYQ